MAIFRSRWNSFVIWLGDKKIIFNDGFYKTDDLEEIEALKNCSDFGVTLFLEEEKTENPVQVEQQETQNIEEKKKRGRPPKNKF